MTRSKLMTGLLVTAFTVLLGSWSSIGEGTGLGLSLSYDIVVKQHIGSIEVDTQPGEFTEFRVILPRKATLSKAGVNS